MHMENRVEAPRARATTLLLLAGFSGILFIATFVVLGFVAPGYQPLRETISALELTPLHMAQQVNFFVFGILLCLFALGMHRELQGGFGARLIPLFMGLAGLGVMGDAVFLQPGPHMACDLVAFNAALCVLFLFAWRVRKDARWRGWTAYSLLTAVAMMAFLFAFGMMNNGGGPAGLMEKLAATVRSVWSIVLVTRLMSGARLDIPVRDLA